MNSENQGSLENLLNPDVLRQNLIFVSLYIALYENFKTHIIDRVKDFYNTGIDGDKMLYPSYEKEVLDKIDEKKNRTIKATLKWLLDNDIITGSDICDFESMTNIRNQLAHEMTNCLYNGIPEETYYIYAKMLKLFEKIEKWWIINYELELNPDITDEQYESIDMDSVSSSNILFLRMMGEVAFTDTKKYYEMLK